MNAEIIKDFLAGLGFQQNADESLDTLGSTITRNITNLGLAADVTARSMGSFIECLANGLDSFSTPPLGGAFSANAATPATGTASSLTGLASLTGTLAGLNQLLQAPSFQAATVLTPLATALAPTLTLMQGAGQSDAANQTGTGNWGAVINKVGTSLSGLLARIGTRSPQSDTGGAAANRQQAGMNRASRPLAGYSPYQVLNGGRNKALNTADDNGMGSVVQAVRSNASAIAGTNAPGNDNAATARLGASDIVRNSALADNKAAAAHNSTLDVAEGISTAINGRSTTLNSTSEAARGLSAAVKGSVIDGNRISDVAGGVVAADDKSAAVANNAQNTDSDAEQTVTGFSAMPNSLINTVKGLVATLGRNMPFGDSGKRTHGGSAKPASGSGAAGYNASTADISPAPSVTSTDIEQNGTLSTHSLPPQTGNPPDSVPQAAASGQGGIASLQILLEGARAKVRQLTDLAQAGRNISGGAQGNLNSDISGDGAQSALNRAMSGGALGNLAKGFNVNPTALLNIAGPRLSASLTGGTGQWEQGRTSYANGPTGRTGAATGATTLNQTTNITVNGAAAPSETANNIADRQISVNATLTQLLSPKAR